jgi:hypothetical protein
MNRPVVRLTQLLLLAALLGLALSSGSARAVTRGESAALNPVNLLDCNGRSPAYRPLKLMGGLCTDPITVDGDGDTYRFFDNGHYVGHDEPSVKFISTAPGSGNTMTYYMQLGVDPIGQPTADGTTSDYAELSPAPWFGLPICDQKSYPQNPCTPDSDRNSGALTDPNSAGSAFMELQFYPPGFAPFHDAISCDKTHYCSALNIDSLECTFAFATCNNNCIEPVNFAFLQKDGVPTGPPSPQDANDFTLSPNNQTLRMNQGDALKVTLADTPSGFRVEVDDLTTHQSGFMVASAANGFKNTNIADCSGTPFTFHPEYNTAAQQNQVPWAALEGGVLMEQEIGHFESCDSVANSLGQFAFDPQTFQTCMGGAEGPNATGEGPCDFTTGVCTGATTENGAACPTNNFASGALCEFSDGTCIAKGPRPLSLPSEPPVLSWPVAGCQQNQTQNGDLDFEGNSYRPFWPDGAKNHPQPYRYAGPFDAGGNPYPSIQFETDVGGSEILCNTATGAGCTAPPTGAAFYPFWTIGSQNSPFVNGKPQSACLWNFGNTIPGTTTNSFGGAAEYGTPNVSRYAGTLTSPVLPNPQLTGC